MVTFVCAHPASAFIFFELLILLVIYLTVPQSFSLLGKLLIHICTEIGDITSDWTHFLFISTATPPSSMTSILTDTVHRMLGQPEQHGWIHQSLWTPAYHFVRDLILTPFSFL